MGFNSGFKGLNTFQYLASYTLRGSVYF